MDPFDQAQRAEQKDRDAAVKAAVAQARAGGEGSADCVDCHDPIPEARRKANPKARRCVDCQTEYEGHRR